MCHQLVTVKIEQVIIMATIQQKRVMLEREVITINIAEHTQQLSLNALILSFTFYLHFFLSLTVSFPPCGTSIP